MTRIDAATPGVGALLADVVDVVERAGAVLHPDLRLVERHGEMQVECTAGEGAELARVPTAVLIPYDEDEARTPEQALLLDLQLDLYRATGKPHWYRTAHPRGAFAGRPDLVAAVRAIRRDWSPDESLAGFLRTRALSVKSRAGQRLLMPVIDAMNHHETSPGYAVDAVALTVAVSRPTGTPECFVKYHRHPDALAMALDYGFVDDSAHCIDSTAVRVEVAGVGLLEVTADLDRPGTAGDFPVVTAGPGALCLSHLRIDALRPTTAREAVRLPVRAAAARAGLAEPDALGAADRAWESVIAANVEALEHLLATLYGEPGPAALTVAAAVRHQVALLTSLT